MTTVIAPAKLTVSLRIIGVRSDGYHLVDAEMVSLALHDTLTFADGAGITVSGPYGDGVPTDDTNLVAKALRLSGRTAAVHINKQIPAQGGLGGGSADAAAVLRWAGIRDPDIAVRIGADVPFCVAGGQARVRGIGELVEPMPPVDRVFTLCLPPFGASTAEVYRAWDVLGGPKHERNDLTAAALAVEPRLAAWFDWLGALSGQQPVLAGSGSTLFIDGALNSPVEGPRATHLIEVRTAP
jgi:4-diphosphocytidyl-2-C-methyl-D-erythritol kinase